MLRRAGAALLLGLLFAVLPVSVDAHHPEVFSVSISCGLEPGSARLDYTVGAWTGNGSDPTNDPSRANADIQVRLSVDRGPLVEIGRGAFAAPDYLLSGWVAVPADSRAVIEVRALDAWGNGRGGGEARRSGAFLSPHCTGPEATPSATATPTASPTSTPAPTATPLAGPEPTATPTENPTATPTESPTATPTESPTASPTPTATATATSTPTATPTATAVPSPTPALTFAAVPGPANRPPAAATPPLSHGTPGSPQATPVHPSPGPPAAGPPLDPGNVDAPLPGATGEGSMASERRVPVRWLILGTAVVLAGRALGARSRRDHEPRR